jgi:predicted subunit of tRNA(5-methylaminomethyl-2-thiouridylate) methyltransferase
MTRYRVVTLDRFNREYETVRINLTLSDAKKISKETVRVLGKKSKVIAMEDRKIL